MAQWSHTDKTLQAKLVYYGPALGGKTTNLESLHRLTDPRGENRLVSLHTGDDRTLYFDLLPFELGDIFGYRVALKAYTVPGQVHYDATRRIVLAGADAVVFVADSTPGKEQQNQWALQNLHANLRANGLDPERTPILFQFNKQDVPGALEVDEMSRCLGLNAGDGFPAVALRSRGVLEIFVDACKRMIEGLIDRADSRTRAQIDIATLGQQIDAAFAPHIQRLHGVRSPVADARDAPGRTRIKVEGDGVEDAVAASLELGERLAAEAALANRLEHEADALRQLSDSLQATGASFDREAIVESALDAARSVIGASVVSLVEGEQGTLALEQSVGGEQDPLLDNDSGRDLIARMIGAGGACVVDDVGLEIGPQAAQQVGTRAVASVPVGAGRVVLAHAPYPDGRFESRDTRFLTTLASHLESGLEKARLHDEVTASRDRLDELVQKRTAQLRRAHENLKALDKTKERFVANLSHEMRTPLTAVLSAATFLRDYEVGTEERKESLETIVAASENLGALLDNLFRTTEISSGSDPLRLGPADAASVAHDAIELAGVDGVELDCDMIEGWQADSGQLARAVSNLLDNAFKFSPPTCPVKLQIRQANLRSRGGERPGVVLRVADRGPGVPEADRKRVFAPFEQGGEVLTGKPRGIGVGLYEARAIARAHCGRLDYRDREGGGADFVLCVPLAPLADTGSGGA